MVKIYAIVLALGTVALIAWIFFVYLAGNSPSFSRFEPETRFGRRGRVVVAAMEGFGMAGLSAEFSPRDIAWPFALGLALIGAGVAAWFAVWIDHPREKAGSIPAASPAGDPTSSTESRSG
jgi:NhaP-type Na+/H+ or K+/H+ antiporter